MLIIHILLYKMKLYTVLHLLCTNYKYTIITKLFSILNVTKYNMYINVNGA